MKNKFNVGILVFINIAIFVFLFAFVLKQQEASSADESIGAINIMFIFIGGLQALFTYRHVKRHKEESSEEPSTLERLRAISKKFDEELSSDTYNLDEDEEFDEIQFREDENKRKMRNYRYCKHCGEGLEDGNEYCSRCGEKS